MNLLSKNIPSKDINSRYLESEEILLKGEILTLGSDFWIFPDIDTLKDSEWYTGLRNLSYIRSLMIIASWEIWKQSKFYWWLVEEGGWYQHFKDNLQTYKVHGSPSNILSTFQERTLKKTSSNFSSNFSSSLSSYWNHCGTRQKNRKSSLIRIRGGGKVQCHFWSWFQCCFG